MSGTVSDELFVQNLLFTHEFAVFTKRKHGGTFHGSFETQAEAEAAIEELDGDPDRYEIQETARHYCLQVDPENGGKPITPCVIFMKGTALRTSRNWNTDIGLKGDKVDRFAGVWKLSTQARQNDSGKWYGFLFEFVGWASEAVYNESKEQYIRLSAPQAVAYGT